MSNYEPIISCCQNDAKDRHVLAAAIKANAELIVTFNTRHFPKSAVEPWSIEVSHPDEFLIHIFHLNPETVIHLLHEQSREINRNVNKLLHILNAGVPGFVQLISETLGSTS